MVDVNKYILRRLVARGHFLFQYKTIISTTDRKYKDSIQQHRRSDSFLSCICIGNMHVKQQQLNASTSIRAWEDQQKNPCGFGGGVLQPLVRESG